MKHTTASQVADFSKRLNEVLDEKNFPAKHEGRQTKAALRFGVTQKAARKWLEGEGLPKTSRINAIARELGVRAAWLLSGDGPKYAGQLIEADLAPETLADLKRLVAALQTGKLSPERFRGAALVLLSDLDHT